MTEIPDDTREPDQEAVCEYCDGEGCPMCANPEWKRQRRAYLGQEEDRT